MVFVCSRFAFPVSLNLDVIINLDPMFFLLRTFPVNMNIFLFLGAEVEFTGIEKMGRFVKKELGRVQAFRSGSLVFVSIARLAGSGCGQAFILYCTPSLSCQTHQAITTRALNMQFYNIADETYILVDHWGTKTSSCPSSPELLKFDATASRFISQQNLTTALIGNIGLNKPTTDDLSSLSPSTWMNNALDISVLSSMLSHRRSVVKHTFLSNGATYVVTGSAIVGVYYLELFALNTTNLETRKLQEITTKEVFSVDIAVVNNNTMLAIAEGRHGNNRVVKIYSFLPKKRIFSFFQRISVAGNYNSILIAY